jgi:hypothetical protein
MVMCTYILHFCAKLGAYENYAKKTHKKKNITGLNQLLKLFLLRI